MSKDFYEKKNKDTEVENYKERDDSKCHGLPVRLVEFITQFFSLFPLFGDNHVRSVGPNTHFPRVAMISFAVYYLHGD